MKILILCTGNSCRSQMAEGILRFLGPDLQVYSAGTSPAETVHPMAVRVMREIGIDISSARPKAVEQYLSKSFDYVITVCDHANETCPVFTGVVQTRLHMGFEDPAMATGTEKEILDEFRRIRDEIRSEFTAWYRTEVAPKRKSP